MTIERGQPADRIMLDRVVEIGIDFDEYIHEGWGVGGGITLGLVMIYRAT